MTLKQRFYLTLAALAGFSLLGALVMIWYTYRMEGLLTGITEQELAALRWPENSRRRWSTRRGS